MLYPFAHRDAAPKCLGSYERELHDEIERFVARGYSTILNVGCGEGYYAVGFARRIPAATVHAYDWNPRELALCRQLAVANQIPDSRMAFGFVAAHETLDRVGREGALLIVDVEGDELELLDPTKAPGLAAADILVELHEFAAPGVEAALRRRFGETHDIRAVESEPRDDPEPYPELISIRRHDQISALRERPFPMRWLTLDRSRTSSPAVPAGSGTAKP